jgi:predicted negative regulator of RcsB-dependent stress response
VAKYKKKRARELQHDRFRDTTMSFFDRLGNVLEGRGRMILYGLIGLIVAGLVIFQIVRWSNKKSDEARQALGRAITISRSQVTTSPIPGNTDPTFATDKERAQRSIEEFEKVAAKYGDPYRSESQYFIASNRLVVDRQKGISELTELQNSKVGEVATLSKFALAQAYESDGKLDDAARHYTELAKQNSAAVTAETANLRLAKVYEKQGKKKEAADLLFNIVDASRKTKGTDNLPLPQSSAAREAAEELQKLDPDRYAQLPPETPAALAG